MGKSTKYLYQLAILSQDDIICDITKIDEKPKTWHYGSKKVTQIASAPASVTY